MVNPKNVSNFAAKLKIKRVAYVKKLVPVCCGM